MRLALVDPPYVGREDVYRGHPDYRDEPTDYAAIAARLDAGRYDGWAVCCSADTAYDVETELRQLRRDLRRGIWPREPVHVDTHQPRYSHEVVIVAAARYGRARWPTDVLWGVGPVRSHPRAVIGAKPPEWSCWVFGLLGARASDTLDDWYPGSGQVGEAWDWFVGRDLLPPEPGDPRQLTIEDVNGTSTGTRADPAAEREPMLEANANGRAPRTRTVRRRAREPKDGAA